QPSRLPRRQLRRRMRRKLARCARAHRDGELRTDHRARSRGARGSLHMNSLTLRSEQDCGWDLVALGEVMLRLDPGDGRIATARSFRAWEGGGEYNVARGLKRCFTLDTAVVTALADNPVGRLVEDFMLQGGVSTKHVRWIPFDGV